MCVSLGPEKTGDIRRHIREIKISGRSEGKEIG